MSKGNLVDDLIEIATQKELPEILSISNLAQYFELSEEYIHKTIKDYKGEVEFENENIVTYGGYIKLSMILHGSLVSENIRVIIVYLYEMTSGTPEVPGIFEFLARGMGKYDRYN